MDIKLHRNATTTPRIRALIQVSCEPGTVLARRFGVGEETIARWQHRDSVQHRHRLVTGGNQRPHVWRGAGLFVQGDQHVNTSRSTDFPSPASSRNTSRASNSGDRDGTI